MSPEKPEEPERDAGAPPEIEPTVPAHFRRLWFAGGMVCLALGVIGAILPIMPTVIFLIGAAACFARSNPVWEARLVQHPIFGPHIRAWRERRAISRKGKWAATLGLIGGSAFSLIFLPMPWAMVTPSVTLVLSPWIWTRPEY